MAKLVRVCRINEENNSLESYQIPLVIDGDLKMIMEIPPNELLPMDELWDFGSFDDFMRRYKNLNVDELAVSFMVTRNEVLSFLSQTVPCVGCRQSVEKLYNHIMKTSQPALKPLHIMQSGVLTIDPSILKNPLLLHTILYCRGSKLNEILESIPKCRRNRRCVLHSLETHKSRTPIGCWVDVWEALSQKCQDEVLTINSDTLLDALENHLRKNRFCTECKRKVLKAFGILTGDIEAEKVKGYCASLYEGLKSCPLHKHVHVQGDVEFLTVLLEKAEHELSGMRRERHAKSMDTAQEEVLTCLAVFMWERLHHLWQKLRTEEQSWQMLYHVGINTLRRSFEVSVEEKQGMSRLEQVVEEISTEEKEKEVKREQKRQKKRARRKEKCKCVDTNEMSADCKGSKEGLSVKNGEDVNCMVHVKTCEKNGNALAESENTCEKSKSSRESNNELSVGYEHCAYADNSDSSEHSSNCSEKWPQNGQSCSAQSQSYSNSMCEKSECDREKPGHRACPNQGWGKSNVKEFDKQCPEQGWGKSGGPNPSKYECEKPCPPEKGCGISSLSPNCSPRHESGKAKPSQKQRRGGKNKSCSHAWCSHGVSRQNGLLTEEINHDCHDNVPVDDEEKQLLLSMGWNSAESYQDDSLLDETEMKISKEEIQHFKANQKQLINQRLKLREKLREQFNSLSMTAHASR